MRFLHRILRSKRNSRIRRENQARFGLEPMEQRLMFSLPSVTAEAAIVTTGDGDVLGELNADEQRAMASTTKIMTALIAIEQSEAGTGGLSLTDEVEIGYFPGVLNNAGNGSGDGFDVGETANLFDLLYATMLESDNEAANAVAEHIAIHQPDASHSEVSHNLHAGRNLMADFAHLMNERADQLGLDDTHFRTPDGAQYFEDTVGLNFGGHHSSASDLAALAKHAMQNETFAQIVGTGRRTITINEGGNDEREYDLKNTNKLVRKNHYPGAEGVKTGTTPMAGACLVSQATILGRTIRAAVLGSTSDDRYKDSKALLDYGFEEAYDFIVDRGAHTVATPVGTWNYFTDDDNVERGVLTIQGRDIDDVAVLTVAGDVLFVELNGDDEYFPLDDLIQVNVNLGDGNDQVTVNGDATKLPIYELTPSDMSSMEDKFDLLPDLIHFGSGLNINGGGGSDTLTLLTSGVLLGLDGPDSGHADSMDSDRRVITFNQFEGLAPDDHSDQLDEATTIPVLAGWSCCQDVEVSGFLGSTNDQDWFQLQVGTGDVTLALQSDAEIDATLELWSLSDNGNPTFLGSADVNDDALTVAGEEGQYAIRVSGASQFGRYTLVGNIPSPPLSPRDLFGIPEKPQDFWPSMPTRRFDPVGPVAELIQDVGNADARTTPTRGVVDEALSQLMADQKARTEIRREVSIREPVHSSVSTESATTDQLRKLDPSHRRIR